MNYIYNCNDVEAMNMHRMRTTPFTHLVKTLLQNNIHTYVEEQVTMFLHTIDHNQRLE